MINIAGSTDHQNNLDGHKNGIYWSLTYVRSKNIYDDLLATSIAHPSRVECIVYDHQTYSLYLHRYDDQ